MNAEELNRLEALARAATPGPWRAASADEAGGALVLVHGDGDSIAGFDPVGPWISEEQAKADLQFAAELNPSTVLRLIAECRRKM